VSRRPRVRLSARIPRALGLHLGDEGNQFTFRFGALAEHYGPFSTRLERLEAARVASLGVQLDLATAALVNAQRKRREGRGRKPTVQQIERLARRQGLADTSYAASLARLEELVAAKPRPVPKITELVGRNGR
jgi:hypothetical protein